MSSISNFLTVPFLAQRNERKKARMKEMHKSKRKNRNKSIVKGQVII